MEERRFQEKEPDLIVLDTKRLLKGLRAKIRSVTDDPVEEVDFIDDLVRCLKNEDDAALELDYFCMSMIEDAINSVCEKELTDVAMQAREVGNKIVNELKALKLYRRNHLLYDFECMLGLDIVLRINAHYRLARLWLTPEQLGVPED